MSHNSVHPSNIQTNMGTPYKCPRVLSQDCNSWCTYKLEVLSVSAEYSSRACSKHDTTANSSYLFDVDLDDSCHIHYGLSPLCNSRTCTYQNHEEFDLCYSHSQNNFCTATWFPDTGNDSTALQSTLASQFLSTVCIGYIEHVSAKLDTYHSTL